MAASFEDLLEQAAQWYFVFAFEEGTPAEIEKARLEFNKCVSGCFETICRWQQFERPTLEEFRAFFIVECRQILREKGLI